ncbi:hypothetical protein WUBG_17273 [Wuchereria bancrofti]|uniref:Uncharacterized protein n=1 Tax=Wuchereria bancrofti TaxID=6293 RepID=J9ACU1_WUCBA|nr:hypothetical protein WUBG_17273 [Wuchereria bancrofti]
MCSNCCREILACNMHVTLNFVLHDENAFYFAIYEMQFNRNGRAKIKRKTEFSADIILNSSDWPYTTTIRGSNSMINGDLLYGSAENNFMKHKAIRVTSNSLRLTFK